jgi:hypothetical protein
MLMVGEGDSWMSRIESSVGISCWNLCAEVAIRCHNSPWI